MARQHGVSSSTYQRLIIDSGAVYKNYGIASRTITLASVIATDAITVAVTTSGTTTTTTFTCVASGASGNNFNVGGSDTETATNLNTLITAMSGITSTSSGAVITVVGDSVTDLVTITTSDTTFTLTSNGINTTLLGATRGGNTFTIEQEIRDMPVDGAHGSVEGGRRIVGVKAMIKANMLEWSSDLIEHALPGSSSANWPSGSATHDEITRALALTSANYLANVTIVGEVSGEANPIICGINNALADGNFELGFTDKDESVGALTFTAHFDPDALDTEPWFIRYPQ